MSNVPPRLRCRQLPNWIVDVDSGADELSNGANKRNLRCLARAVAILWDIVASHAKHEHCPDCNDGLDSVERIGGPTHDDVP